VLPSLVAMTAGAPYETKQGQPIVAFPSAADWERWLDENHAIAPGVWVKFARKASGIPTVTYAEAVEVALCYGWIDGQAASFDDTYHLQRFTPRTARSKWSKINTTRALDLIAAGRMKPAGLAAIEQARSDGRWDQAYDPPSKATIPDDLQARLDENPEAAAFFATLNSQNRFAVLHRIDDAKRPETRARRIETFVAMLKRHEKPYR
jgi:uncharacterized protein YdeI (YjbR/CyaY-like superfamily)